MERRDFAMATSTELLTPAEAAVVADVSVRDVNRVFDEKILPQSFLEVRERRWVRSDACAYVRFYFHTANRLTAPERIHVIHDLLVSSHHGDWVSADHVLTVNFDHFVSETLKRLSELRRARELVDEDPEVLGGTPVVRGTRVPVYDIAASLDAGRSAEEVRAAYPSLPEGAVTLAKLYATANPPRGRPGRRGRPDMRVLGEGRRPRQSCA
jgi:uncharacterized protein (DUF433 family)